jgi:hypothetical protein
MTVCGGRVLLRQLGVMMRSGGMPLGLIVFAVRVMVRRLMVMMRCGVVMRGG